MNLSFRTSPEVNADWYIVDKISKGSILKKIENMYIYISNSVTIA